MTDTIKIGYADERPEGRENDRYEIEINIPEDKFILLPNDKTNWVFDLKPFYDKIEKLEAQNKILKDSIERFLSLNLDLNKIAWHEDLFDALKKIEEMGNV